MIECICPERWGENIIAFLRKAMKYSYYFNKTHPNALRPILIVYGKRKPFSFSISNSARIKPENVFLQCFIANSIFFFFSPLENWARIMGSLVAKLGRCVL